MKTHFFIIFILAVCMNIKAQTLQNGVSGMYWSPDRVFPAFPTPADTLDA
jgi:hypothetical protein